MQFLERPGKLGMSQFLRECEKKIPGNYLNYISNPLQALFENGKWY